MDELEWQAEGEWDAGFVAGSQVVVARLGPYQNIFLRPQPYRRRFFHALYELPIDNWTPEPLQRSLAGGACRVEAHLDIRLQASLAYVRAHPESLPDTVAHIRAKFQSLLRDQVENLLRELEDGTWLLDGCAATERRVEDAVQVALALQQVRCRCQCRLQPQLDSEALLADLAPASLRLRENYRILQSRQEEERARQMQFRLAQEKEAQRLQLEHQATLLELTRASQAIERETQEQAVADLKEKLSAEESRLRETMSSEIRRQQEKLRHELELQTLKLGHEVEELQHRLRTLDDKDDCVKRELELLYLEKQRLLLQDEIRHLKQADR
jgi:hypothetical protein